MESTAGIIQKIDYDVDISYEKFLNYDIQIRLLSTSTSIPILLANEGCDSKGWLTVVTTNQELNSISWSTTWFLISFFGLVLLLVKLSRKSKT